MYLAGFSWIDKKTKKLNPDRPLGRIYRMRLEPGNTMEKWSDLPPGEKSAHAGAAGFDQDGNFMCFNAGTGKVHILDQAGKEIGAFDALSDLAGQSTGPRRLFCHRKTGEIYATYARDSNPKRQYTPWSRKVVKFASWKKGGKVVWEYAAPNSPRGWQCSGIEHAAFDDSAEPPVFWIGATARSNRAKSYLYRLEDRGKELVKTTDLVDRCRKGPGIKTRMAVHPDTELVICRGERESWAAYKGLSGEEVKLPFSSGTEMNAGLDGNWYLQHGPNYSGPICRYDKDLKPLPIPSRSTPPTNVMGSVYGMVGAGFYTAGFAADPRGRVFSLQMYMWANYCVTIFGADGKPEQLDRLKDNPGMKKNKRFNSAILNVGAVSTKTGGLQLDYQGNMYIGIGVRPLKHTMIPGFEKNKAYNWCTGSIIKFGPKGGEVRLNKAKESSGDKGLEMRHIYNRKGTYFLEGAVKAYPEYGNMGGQHGNWCFCRQPMFQVDGWGRIFYPNAITNNVRIVDNNGNLIQKFGHYGNIDSRGPGEKSLIKKPAIPLGWPQAVGVSRTRIYVADAVNRRIVRLKKVYTAEATCPVK